MMATSKDKLGDMLPLVLEAVPDLLTGPLELAGPIWSFLGPQVAATVNAHLAAMTPEQLDDHIAQLISTVAAFRSDDAPALVCTSDGSPTRTIAEVLDALEDTGNHFLATWSVPVTVDPVEIARYLPAVD